MRFLSVILATGMLFPVLTGRAQVVVDGIKAVVHDSVITKTEVEELTLAAAAELERQYRGQPAVRDQKLNEALEETLERLVDNQMILHEFATAGYNLPESIIEQSIQEQVRVRYGDRVRLIKELQSQGITYEQYRQRMRDDFIVRQMRYLKTSGELIISPHRIEVYYEGNKDQFQVEEQVKLRMLVLTNNPGVPGQNRRLAEEILSKLNEGASFAEMASLYSHGAQARNGGDWGWVEKSVLRQELAEAAFALQSGQRSGIVDTPQACYLMQVEDRRSASVKPLSEVRQEIEAALRQQEYNRLQKQWIERLRKKTFHRYF